MRINFRDYNEIWIASWDELNQILSVGTQPITDTAFKSCERWMSIAHELGHKALQHEPAFFGSNLIKQQEKAAWQWAFDQQKDTNRRAKMLPFARACLRTYDVKRWTPKPYGWWTDAN